MSTDEAQVAYPKPASVEPTVKVTPNRKTSIWDWLELVGKRAGLPSLLVGLIAIGLSTCSLSYIIANYNLTVAANRPYLVSYGMKADFDKRSADTQIGFNNVGKVTARRAVLTLFSLSELDAKPVKLVAVPIVGAGTNIFPGFGSTARFDPHLTDKAPFMLACAKYFDDAGTTYEQAFLFQRGEVSPTTNQLPYSELAQPDQDRCKAAAK
ncbi:hypothetical protein [Bradyrhizobium sp.]|uniref:hypothetical protein n=1 Tax=Bradyrhizobium sp. TaxID=376 RepID=UPI00260A568B|nr:hypothetical protein [Bradyrhizobium sp.]